ncbi:TPA: LPXTG cell wall anchor domain-containing protein, partial [Streptococcus suis]|nr:LPXTG cell wall anchor domain-containing protein [Streptococcus suis]
GESGNEQSSGVGVGTGGSTSQSESSPTFVNPVKPGDSSITGLGKPDGLVTVTKPDGAIVTVPVASNGTWTAPIEGVANIGDTFTIIQTEKGKNPSKPVSVVVPKQTDNKLDSPNVITLNHRPAKASDFDLRTNPTQHGFLSPTSFNLPGAKVTGTGIRDDEATGTYLPRTGDTSGMNFLSIFGISLLGMGLRLVQKKRKN